MRVRRPFQMPPGIALAALFSGVGLAASAAGCELVAGIENLQITGTDGSVSEIVPDSSLSSSATVSTDASPNDATPGSESDATLGDAAVPGEAQAPLDGGAPLDGSADAYAPASDGASSSDSSLDAQPSDATIADGESALEDGGDAALALELIDNLESDDGHIIQSGGRSGSWFTYNDGTDGGVQTPAPGSPFLPSPTSPPLGSSVWSAQTEGSGFASFAGMGFTLNDPVTGPDAGVESPYDASGYIGIVFDAHVGSSSSTRLRVGFPDANTNGSGNPFGEFLTLTTEWTQEVVYFSDTTQQNFGPQFSSLDTSAIYSIIFQMDATTPPLTFDLWVDNVYFILP